MRWELIFLLVVCAMAAAMVPRNRRSQNTEPLFCAPQTPCAWSIYQSPFKNLLQTLENSYCVCKAGQTCQRQEEDKDTNTYVHRCVES